MDVFRRLVRAGPDGMAAGEIARSAGVLTNTMSSHLSNLSAAGLVTARRDGRSIIYAASYDRMRALLSFLMQDCCNGEPEICGPLAAFAQITTRNRPEISMLNTPMNVLFLCTGNSARSILAEVILNQAGGGRFRAWSAGSMPAGRVNPHALALLESRGLPTAGLRSKSWDEFSSADGPSFDFVFTVCDNAAAEVCPIWPGQPITAHWGIPDPAAAPGSEAEVAMAFADAYRMLQRRIDLFLALPIASLDRLALTDRLRDIGLKSEEGREP